MYIHTVSLYEEMVQMYRLFVQRNEMVCMYHFLYKETLHKVNNVYIKVCI